MTWLFRQSKMHWNTQTIMPNIFYNNNKYHCNPGESVLEAFLRHGVDVSFSCRSGICQVCLLYSENGNVPKTAQKNLKQGLIDRNYFMACQCCPEEDMVISLPRSADMLTRAIVAKKEFITPSICRLLLEPASDIYYHPGQFINLKREDGEMRSYSLASVPSEDYFLELHIKKVENGLFSHWIFNELSENDEIEFQGVNGDCYYHLDDKDKPMLLVATGTGVSPLVGIIRDALSSGHQGDIYLYHGSSSSEGLYLQQRLLQLETQYSNFYYFGCVSQNNQSQGYSNGRAHEIAFNKQTDLSNWSVYLSGHPGMVKQSVQMSLEAGAEQKNIHSDPFWSIDDTQEQIVELEQERRRYPEPALEIWNALEQGKLLTPILEDFYERVYNDPNLASFFDNTTKQRSIEKQYNFLYQMFTGEKVYFGDRPKNAHHWMVISNELFDYRADLLVSCAQKHGLDPHIIDKWRAMEEFYRDDIVKEKPISRFKFGKEIPLDGYEELVLDFGTLCDHCQSEVNIGDTVRYHTRIGKIYCSQCMEKI